MLQYVIKVTDNSLLTVLIVSLLLVVAERFLQAGRRKPLLWGLFAGCLAALVYAVLKRNTGFAVREYYDLGVLLLSVPAAVLFLPALVGASSAFFRCIARLFLFCLAGTWTAYCLPNLFLYPFEFAVGMDTIFNTDFMYTVAGYLAGLLLMFLTGASFYYVAGRLSSRVVVPAFAAGLCVVVSFQVLTVAQILLGRNMISRTQYKWLMGPVMWGLDHGNYFIYALTGLAFLLALVLFLRVGRAPVVGDNPAQRRKTKADARRQSRFAVGLAVVLVASLLTLTVGQSYANRRVELSPPQETAANDGRIIIPLEKVNDGNLHRFVYKASDGTDVRYIVIRKSDVAFGVGLDACDVCGASGYYQRKDQVVCILCDVVMNISTIGFPGGCNPVPLKYSIAEGKMVIETSDLEAEVRRFH